MFNRDALFGKKDDTQRNESRAPVNVTPGLGSANTPARREPPSEPPKPDLRFAELPKPQQPQPQPQPRAQEPTTGSKLIVGPDIKLRGVEITDCDTLVVEGRVEASMDSRVIQIAETGVFSGTVSIDVAEIRGRFEGELTARKQLVIYATGRVTGQIRYGKIRIEEGGELTGDVSTLTRAAAATVKEISLTGGSPSVPPGNGGTPTTAAQTTPTGSASGNGSRNGQISGSASGETQSVSAAAIREPAPSRGPRSGSKTGSGSNR
jgi:cytoskeletal protein CcmA (bactofilin family)